MEVRQSHLALQKEYIMSVKVQDFGEKKQTIIEHITRQHGSWIEPMSSWGLSVWTFSFFKSRRPCENIWGLNNPVMNFAVLLLAIGTHRGASKGRAVLNIGQSGVFVCVCVFVLIRGLQERYTRLCMKTNTFITLRHKPHIPSVNAGVRVDNCRQPAIACKYSHVIQGYTSQTQTNWHALKPFVRLITTFSVWSINTSGSSLKAAG